MTYIDAIRTKLGNQNFIHPATRVIVIDEDDKVLFIRKQESGMLGIPAGGIEENETIEECARREVREETGIEVLSLELIGIKSNPIENKVTYPNGDIIQYITLEFLATSWMGCIGVKDHEEVSEAMFLSLENIDRLPDMEKSTFDSLNHYRKTGKVLLA